MSETFAQNNFLLFEDITEKSSAERHQQYVSNQKYLDVSSKSIDAIQNNKPEFLNLTMPPSLEMEELQLEKANVFAGGYLLKDENGRAFHSDNEYTFYRGKVKGKDQSLVVVTFVNDEVKMLISTNQKNYRIHLLKDDSYVFFKDEDLKESIEHECLTPDSDAKPFKKEMYQAKENRSMVGNCVEIYFECDHESYLDNQSSLANTEGWIASIFNEVQTLYSNEGINISISEVLVWTTPDPYVGLSSTSAILYQFRTDRNASGFNGRLAHFVTTRGIGGGIAWLDVLCSNSSNYAVSGSLNTSVVPFPNYSWNVSVIAHELGHNFGSSHTHACVWNGNNTQIDDCGATYSNPTPSCYDSNNPIIPNKGTVMSYCHLSAGNGIDFALGFGPQPGALILSEFQNANCSTGNCSAPACVALTFPEPNSTNNPIDTDINWDTDLGAEGYKVKIGTSPTNGSIANNLDLGLVTEYDPGLLPFGTTIYVTILPYNSLGDAVGCNNYTFVTEANIPPSCILISSPVDGSVDVSVSTILNWADAPGNQSGYKIRIGTTPEGNEVLNNFDVGNVNEYTPDGLSVLTTYYVTVIPYHSSGDTQGCSYSTFTTNNLLTYCTSQGNNTNDEWVERVIVGDLDHLSGENDGYVDFTNIILNVSAGADYDVSITPGYSGTQFNEAFRIWIDLNRDGDFTDSDEQLFSTGLSNSTVSGTITIPAGTQEGLTRMRVSMKYNGSPGSCETFTYGEVEDYAVDIGGAAPCYMVTNANASGPGSFLAALDCGGAGDTIIFDNSLSGQIIELSNTFAIINENIIIKAENGVDITICGTNTPMVFDVRPGASLHLIGLNVISGTNTFGGAIQNEGTAILENAELELRPNAPTNATLIENSGVLEIKGNTVIIENP